MKNDLTKLKELLDSFGVEYKTNHEGDTTVIHCKEGRKKITGYSYFFTDFNFNSKSGEFISMGAWE